MKKHWMAAAAFVLIAPGAALAGTAPVGKCEDHAAKAAAIAPDLTKAFDRMRAHDKPGFQAMLPQLQKHLATIPAAMPAPERCGAEVRVYDHHQFLAFDAQQQAGKTVAGYPAGTKFVEVNPSYHELAYAVGWIQYELEDFNGAKASYAKGLAIAPNQHDLVKEYVATLLNLGTYGEIVPFVDAFLRSDADLQGKQRADLIAAKGLAQAGSGDTAGATASANQAKAIDPTNQYAGMVLRMVAQKGN